MSKSGTHPHQRERMMRDMNFSEQRNGKGSHVIWEHLGLKELAKTHKIECPSNLLQNPAQKPWEVPLPCDPAVGTWNKITKHAKWADEKANELLGAGVEPDARVETKRAFLEARSEICEWKRDVKHRLRAGLEPNAPPASYPNQIMALEAQMKALRL